MNSKGKAIMTVVDMNQVATVVCNQTYAIVYSFKQYREILQLPKKVKVLHLSTEI